jgi:hypothetical protein
MERENRQKYFFFKRRSMFLQLGREQVVADDGPILLCKGLHQSAYKNQAKGWIFEIDLTDSEVMVTTEGEPL